MKDMKHYKSKNNTFQLGSAFSKIKRFVRFFLSQCDARMIAFLPCPGEDQEGSTTASRVRCMCLALTVLCGRCRRLPAPVMQKRENLYFFAIRGR